MTKRKRKKWWEVALEFFGFKCKKKEKETTTPETEETESQTGTRSTLWKPESESRGGRGCLIIQFPIRWEEIGYVTINGKEEVQEYRLRDRPDADNRYPNGNRAHCFLKKPGSDYGMGIEVKVFMKNGGVLKGIVPNGKERHKFTLV